MKLNPNHKIGFYIRVSTEEQAENPEGSIKNQEDRLRTMVKLKNMESNFGDIIDVYIDRARSGKDTKRPELQRLLHDIRLKKINLVMSSELSRISRSMKDFSEIWEMMKGLGCGFCSLRENFDTTTAAGEMVLYTLANLAQFERRQVSERVSANMNSRAARGLYNGGSVPVGYELLPDKPGHLGIEKKTAEIIRMCFKVFLREGTLSHTAKWLNDNNYQLPKKVYGGGLKQRLSYFTVDNLHYILRNKVYVGVREFVENGVKKDVTALWEPIIERHVFDSVQKLLTENRSAKKAHSETRYPYILTGLVFCAKCGDPMVGKSAHGKREKIGYYEHSWATKRQSCMTKKIFNCDPHRVNAKKVEGLVLAKFKELLSDSELVKDLVIETQRHHGINPHRKEVQRLKALIGGYNSQLEAVSERLSQLPKSVSPKFFFTQMEKLEKSKVDAGEQISALESQGAIFDRPAQLNDFKVFLEHLKAIADTSYENKDIQNRLLKRVVKKIELGTNSIRFNFLVSEMNVKRGIADLLPITNEKTKGPATSTGSLFKLAASDNLSRNGCSNSLTSGARSQT